MAVTFRLICPHYIEAVDFPQDERKVSSQSGFKAIQLDGDIESNLAQGRLFKKVST